MRYRNSLNNFHFQVRLSQPTARRLENEPFISFIRLRLLPHYNCCKRTIKGLFKSLSSLILSQYNNGQTGVVW